MCAVPMRNWEIAPQDGPAPSPKQSAPAQLRIRILPTRPRTVQTRDVMPGLSFGEAKLVRASGQFRKMMLAGLPTAVYRPEKASKPVSWSIRNDVMESPC